MFFIESAGFFVLLMYERLGMGVGVEMGICIKHSCVFINLLLEMYENLNMDQTLQFCYKLEYCLVKLFDIKN